MKSLYMNYYFFKDVLSNVKESILSEFVYDDSLIFNFSNFLNIPYFAYAYSLFKKDKYNLYEKMNNDFYDFFLDCVIQLNMKNDYKRLFFLYALITTKTLHEYLTPYINKYKEKQETLDDIYNMLDYYYAYSSGIDLTKEYLYEVFDNAYSYYDYVDNLIHYPIVKNYHFMASKNYYIKAYKRFYKYCKHDSAAKSKIGFNKLFDKVFRKGKKEKYYFVYQAKLNTSILDRKSDPNLNQVLKNAKEASLARIHAMNDYLFTKNTKLFKKTFNISEDKKI